MPNNSKTREDVVHFFAKKTQERQQIPKMPLRKKSFLCGGWRLLKASAQYVAHIFGFFRTRNL